MNTEPEHRYYISKQLAQDAEPDAGGWRLPARTLEAAVLNPIRELLLDQSRLIDILHLEDQSMSDLQLIIGRATDLVGKIMTDDAVSRKDLLKALIHRVELRSNTISIELSREAFVKLLEIKAADDNIKDSNIIALNIAIKLKRKGVEAKLIIAGGTKDRQPDPDLCRLIAKAKYWLDQLATGEGTSVKDIAKMEKCFDTEITRALPFAFLAPEIVEDILNGRQPDTLNVKDLTRINPLPTDWHEQKKRLGYPN